MSENHHGSGFTLCCTALYVVLYYIVLWPVGTLALYCITLCCAVLGHCGSSFSLFHVVLCCVVLCVVNGDSSFILFRVVLCYVVWCGVVLGTVTPVSVCSVLYFIVLGWDTDLALLCSVLCRLEVCLPGKQLLLFRVALRFSVYTLNVTR